MKKLMIALAAVAVAAVAQAAAVNWNSSVLYTAASANGGFSDTKIGAGATGWLFVLTEAQYNDFLDDYNANGNMKSVYDAYKGSIAEGGTKSGSRSNAVSITTEADVGDTVYGAVIYTYTGTIEGKDVDFYIANIGTGTVEGEVGLSIGNLGTAYLGGTSTASTGGWQTVPEPTSGLLLLLGMAGLALKRKRA